MKYMNSLSQAIDESLRGLKQYGTLVEPAHWQGQDVTTRPEMQPFELMNLAWTAPLPSRDSPEDDRGPILEQLQYEVQPNLPWADDHFEERVSRVPSNPGEQYMNWPFWRPDEAIKVDAETRPTYDESGTKQLTNFKFTHTYQERFWPKRAGLFDEQISEDNHGIRYRYGDLDDVVALLLREPYTRQAYLPIFFPEDTGAVHGGRIPCTLGYHFMLRNGKLHIWYTIRSCDALRHFRDDVYMACRLLLWVLQELRGKYQVGLDHIGQPRADMPDWRNVRPGNIAFHAYSFHCFKGDLGARLI